MLVNVKSYIETLTEIESRIIESDLRTALAEYNNDIQRVDVRLTSSVNEGNDELQGNRCLVKVVFSKSDSIVVQETNVDIFTAYRYCKNKVLYSIECRDKDSSLVQ